MKSIEHEYLKMKATEIYKFSRSDFSLLLVWFTTFTTVNYVALGWVFLDKNTIGIWAVWIISIFLFTQSILAILAIKVVASRFLNLGENIKEINNFYMKNIEEENLENNKSPIAINPIASGHYQSTISYITYSLYTLLLIWFTLPIVITLNII